MNTLQLNWKLSFEFVPFYFAFEQFGKFNHSKNVICFLNKVLGASRK